jgi:DNA-3-methyladenine glycosylase II
MRTESRNGRGRFALRPRAPLDVDLTLQRYRLWGVDPANVYRDGAFYRAARLDGRVVPYRLDATGPPGRQAVTVAFDAPDTPRTQAAVRAEARRLLGLDADLAGFYALAARDPVLGPLVRRLPGLRPSVSPDPFEMLVGAIAAQQVNLTFAFTVRARIVRRFGEAVAFDGVELFAFPSPAVLARAEPAALRAMQLTTRKAEFVVGLARAIADGALDLAALARVPDTEVVARLTAVRGLGRWTAEWFLARALGRADAFPADDLGVRRAVEALCFGGRACDAARARRRARAWQPYRSLAVHYLLAGARLARAGA